MTLPDLFNAVAMLEKPDGVIAFPTDTVYGVGCKVAHPEAIEKIFLMKGRSDTKPLVLLGKDRESFEPYIEPPPRSAIELMDWYWPGPLTLVLPKTDKVHGAITRGFPTVALRIPKCPRLLDLLALIPEGVLATTSANISGQAPCLTAAEVSEVLGDKLDFILEDDAAVVEKTASTVAAVEPDGTVRVLRTGSIVLD